MTLTRAILGNTLIIGVTAGTAASIVIVGRALILTHRRRRQRKEHPQP